MLGGASLNEIVNISLETCLLIEEIGKHKRKENRKDNLEPIVKKMSTKVRERVA